VEDVQRPVYFVRKVPQGLEQRYQTIEKAALDMVITVR